MNLRKYAIIFIIGALGDLLMNQYVSNLTNPTGGFLGLQEFYKTLPWWSAMIWAGLIFVVIYFIADLVYYKLLGYNGTFW